AGPVRWAGRPCLHACCRRVGELSGGLGLAGHVRQHELDPLEIADPLAELLTLPGVADGRVQRALGDSHRLGSDTQARAVEGLHRDLEAVALIAEPVLDGDADIVELELGCWRAANPELVFEPWGR